MELKYPFKSDILKDRRTYLMLAFTAALGFYLRYGPFLKMLRLDDTYYQYTIVREILAHGSAPERLALAKYPKGSSLLKAPLALPYFIAITYRLVSPLGISLNQYMVILPPILGGLSTAALYLLAKELFDKKTALFSALIYAILPASISRVFAGFVEKESLAGILIFLWLYFFIRAQREIKPGLLKSYWPAILSGVFMALSALTWGGAAYFSLLLAVSVILLSAVSPDKTLSASTAVMTVIGFVLMHLFSPSAFPLDDFLFNYRYSALTVASVFSIGRVSLPLFARRFWPKRRQFQLAVIVTAFALSAAILFFSRTRLLDAAAAMVSELTGRGGPAGVSEARSGFQSGYTFHLNPFSWLVLFIPIGVYYFAKGFSGSSFFRRAFIPIWLISASYAAFLQVRLFFLLAPAIAMLIGLGFTGLLHLGRAGKIKSFALAAIIVLALYGTVTADMQFARAEKELKALKIISIQEGMTYVRENTPNNSVVFSWWDHGYVIQGLGERATMVDPGISGRRRINSAKIFTSSEDKAFKIINRVKRGGRPAYLMVTIDEIFKYPSIKSLSGDQDLIIGSISEIPLQGNPAADNELLLKLLKEKESTIFWRNLQQGGSSYQLIYLPNIRYPVAANNLLPMVLPFYEVTNGQAIIPFGFGKRLDHFQLVWQNGYVFIYRVV